MQKYLLDSNVIIKFWNDKNTMLERLMKEDKIVILEQVLEEISVKERREYKGNYILSDRFIKLLDYGIKVQKEDLSGFYLIFDYEVKEKFKNHNLSKNDEVLLYCCYVNKEYNLVTEDKMLQEISKYFLGNNRVYSKEELMYLESKNLR